MQELEREKTDMLNHIRALEKLLTSNGIDVKPWQWSTYRSTGYPPDVVFDSAGNPIPESLAAAGAPTVVTMAAAITMATGAMAATVA